MPESLPQKPPKSQIFHKHGLKRPRIVDDEGYEVIMPAFEE